MEPVGLDWQAARRQQETDAHSTLMQREHALQVSYSAPLYIYMLRIKLDMYI